MLYICPECHGELCESDNKERMLVCSECKYKIPIISDIPVFVSQLKKEKKHGFSEKIFENPLIYYSYIKAKSLIWKDEDIGINEYTRDNNVLDIGCGPSMKLYYYEKYTNDAMSVTGVDLSLSFILKSKAENPEKKFDFAVASIEKLPFPDKCFDTAIIAFVIHHVPIENFPIFEEILRVTKNHIIILDHIRSDNRPRAAIQMLYWNVMDGGCNYLSKSEWQEFLKPVEVVKMVQTGAIFGHVVKFVCRIK